MPVPVWPEASRALRMAFTRPSIMSEGATKSAPAWAVKSDIFTSASTVRSLSTSVPAALRMPSWPCVV